MTTNPVLNKSDMYTRLQRGQFGNHLRAWTPEEFTKSDYSGGVGVRCLTPNGPFRTQMTRKEATEFLQDQDTLDQFLVSEATPDHQLVIQGELTRLFGLDLSFSREKNLSLREAMKVPHRVSGLSAQILLQSTLEPEDYDDLQVLLELYPDHVIEFSSFSVPLGNLNRHMVVWEVRKY